VVVVMAVDADALPLSAPSLLLFIACAQPPAIFLVPCAQWLAAECEVVVFDDGGDHPRVAPEVDFAGRRVGNVEVGDQQVRLRGPVVVRALWGRHGGKCVVVVFFGERASPGGKLERGTIGGCQRSVDIATEHKGVAETKRCPKTKEGLL